MAEKYLDFFINFVKLPVDHTIIDVKRVTTQSVEGVITRIRFIVISLDESSKYSTMSCFTTIYEVEWLNKTEAAITCQDVLGTDVAE